MAGLHAPRRSVNLWPACCVCVCPVSSDEATPSARDRAGWTRPLDGRGGGRFEEGSCLEFLRVTPSTLLTAEASKHTVKKVEETKPFARENHQSKAALILTTPICGDDEKITASGSLSVFLRPVEYKNSFSIHPRSAMLLLGVAMVFLYRQKNATFVSHFLHRSKKKDTQARPPPRRC